MQNISRQHLEHQVQATLTTDREAALAFANRALNGPPMSTHEAFAMAAVERDKSRHVARGTYEFLMDRIGAGGPTIAWGTIYGTEIGLQLNSGTRISRGVTPERNQSWPDGFTPKTIVKGVHTNIREI